MIHLAQWLPPLFLAFAAWTFSRAARRNTGREATAWGFLGATAGMAALFFVARIFDLDSASALAVRTLGWSVGAAAVAGGILLLSTLRTPRQLLGDLADGFIIVLSLQFPVWIFIVEPVLGPNPPLEVALPHALFPVGAFTVGMLVVIAAARSIHPERLAIAGLGASLVLMGMVVAATTLVRFSAGSVPFWLSAMWAAPMLLGAMAALPRPRRPLQAIPRRSVSVRAAIAPIVIVLLANALGAAHHSWSGHIDVIVLLLSAATFTLLALRQLLYIAKNEEMRRQTQRDHERLAAVDAERRGILRVIAHDVLGAFTPVSTVAAILTGEQALSPDQRDRATATLARSARGLERLLFDLRDFARAQDNRLSIERRPTDLALLVRETVQMYQEDAEKAQVHLTVDAPGPVDAFADGDRLRQVLTNLIQNAIKFTPDGGSVHVRMHAQGGAAVLEVRDTGRGLSPEEAASLFRPFVQAHERHEARRAGTGLGLYISKAIAAAHNGTVTVWSAGPGQGSCFTVRLPLVGTTASSGTLDLSTKPASTSPATEGNPVGVR